MILAVLAGSCISRPPADGTSDPPRRGPTGDGASGQAAPPSVGTILIQVRRSGPDTLVVRWQYENHSSERHPIFRGARRLDEVFDESFLLDPVTGTKLLVVRDAENRAVGGVERGPVSVELGPGQSVVLWAKFPAPPSGSGAVTVHIPGAAPFERVAIEP